MAHENSIDFAPPGDYTLTMPTAQDDNYGYDPSPATNYDSVNYDLPSNDSGSGWNWFDKVRSTGDTLFKTWAAFESDKSRATSAGNQAALNFEREKLRYDAEGRQIKLANTRSVADTNLEMARARAASANGIAAVQAPEKIGPFTAAQWTLGLTVAGLAWSISRGKA